MFAQRNDNGYFNATPNESSCAVRSVIANVDDALGLLLLFDAAGVGVDHVVIGTAFDVAFALLFLSVDDDDDDDVDDVVAAVDDADGVVD
jgi:hypothetical protein